jgi:prevent-host-death family protein
MIGHFGYTLSMATVTLRELARNTAAVLQGVQSSGRPALVTRNGRPVAALIPIDETALEEWLLDRAPTVTRAAAAADPGLAAGREQGVKWRRTHQATGDGQRSQPLAARSALRGSHRGE